MRVFGFCVVSLAMGEGGEGEGDCAPKNASLSEVVAPAKKLARQLDFTGAPEHPQLSQPPQLPVAVLPLQPQAPHARVG